MPRSKQQSKPSKELKQQTLLGFINSSSAPPSPAKQLSPKKVDAKRTRVPSLSSRDTSDSNESDVGAIHFEVPVETSDQDDSPRRPTKKRRTQPIRKYSPESISNHPSSADDGELPKLVGKGGFNDRLYTSDEDENHQVRRRKLIKGIRPPSSRELDEHLSDEVDTEKILESRFRARNKKTTFQRNLEKLKLKKSGRSSEPSQSEDNEESSDLEPFEGARPHNDDDSSVSQSEERDEEDEDNFIVEDGGLQTAELPPEYSMGTHQDLSHHFKVICQLFVYLAVQPVHERESFMRSTMKTEQYFSVPLQITRRKLSGLRDSLVISSIWRPEFKKPLETYPELEIIGLDFAIPQCDACHLGGRLSTRLGRLSGSPYNRLSFLPLVDEINSISDDEEENDETPIMEYNLGRFCASRTQVYHQFVHWEYKLYTALAKEIEEVRATRGRRGFVRVAYAKGLKPPDDLMDADGIMEWLDQRHIIDQEWQRVKEMMERARNLEAIAKRGDGDDME